MEQHDNDQPRSRANRFGTLGIILALVLVGLGLWLGYLPPARSDASPDGVYGGVWFPQHPDFAGMIKVRHNGVDLYVPAYFDLTPAQTPIGPSGPVRQP
jgi:hypothetical protein